MYLSEPTVRIRIGDSEEYPVYWAVEDKYGIAVVPQETLDRWNKVIDEYNKVQQEISDAWDKAAAERSNPTEEKDT